MIAGAGFAMMAWRLAHRRVGVVTRSTWWLNKRENAKFSRVCTEYYDILDWAQAGVGVIQSERAHGFNLASHPNWYIRA